MYKIEKVSAETDRERARERRWLAEEEFAGNLARCHGNGSHNAQSRGVRRQLDAGVVVVHLTVRQRQQQWRRTHISANRITRSMTFWVGDVNCCVLTNSLKTHLSLLSAGLTNVATLLDTSEGTLCDTNVGTVFDNKCGAGVLPSHPFCFTFCCLAMLFYGCSDIRWCKAALANVCCKSLHVTSRPLA